MWLLSPLPATAVRAFVAVVVACLLAGATASANCGDYVHVLPPGDAASHTPPPAHCPCADGKCGQPEPAPTTPTDSVERVQRVSDAVLAAATHTSDLNERFAVADDSGEADHTSRAIFHPPRG